MYLECVSVLVILLVFPTFNDIGSLGSLPRRVVYAPGSILGDCLLFPCGEYGGSSKTHHFLFTSTFLCFPAFHLLLNNQQYSAFEYRLLGLLLNNNIDKIKAY